MKAYRHILVIILFGIYTAFAQESKKDEFTYYTADKLILEGYENGKPTGEENVLGMKISITRDNVFHKLSLLYINSERKLQPEEYDLKKAKEGDYIYPNLASGPGSCLFNSYDGTTNPGYHLLIQKGNTFFVLFIKGSQIISRYKFTNVKVDKGKK